MLLWNNLTCNCILLASGIFYKKYNYFSHQSRVYLFSHQLRAEAYFVLLWKNGMFYFSRSVNCNYESEYYVILRFKKYFNVISILSLWNKKLKENISWLWNKWFFPRQTNTKQFSVNKPSCTNYAWLLNAF